MNVVALETGKRSTQRAIELIRRIAEACPRRAAGSAGERRAQDLLAEAFRARGAAVEISPFSWHRSLYAAMSLHFGLAVAASILAVAAPLAALPLHLLAAASWIGDTLRRVFLLRSLLPRVTSHNLLATLPAEGPVRRRVVVVAHADASFTGAVYHPDAIRLATRPLGWPVLSFLGRSMLLATGGMAACAAIDLFAWAYGFGPLSLAALALATVPPLVGFAVSTDVWRRDTLVVGANDNLTGCAAAVHLCDRLAAAKDPDVEVVFAITGSEEAGLGGANALARTGAGGRWSPADTVVVVIDGLSNGELAVFEEGELVPIPPTRGLVRVLREAAAAPPSLGVVPSVPIPTGGTDLQPFRVRGYEGISLGAVDRSLGTPRHYHWPTDTPENVEFEPYERSIALIDRFLIGLVGSARPAT